VFDPERTSALNEIVTPMDSEEVMELDYYRQGDTHFWDRSDSTLLKRREAIKGFGISSVEGMMVYLFYDSSSSQTRILKMGSQGGFEHTLNLLIEYLGAQESGKPVVFLRIKEDEIPFSLLGKMGFKKDKEYVGVSMPVLLG